mmetsp:Transcript_28233/g.44041  ORF Transcript_28233/g.44041 Transcript_28233/m.44041 type:complete len:228 (+) Transcript_28233:233-916(+)
MTLSKVAASVLCCQFLHGGIIKHPPRLTRKAAHAVLANPHHSLLLHHHGLRVGRASRPRLTARTPSWGSLSAIESPRLETRTRWLAARTSCPVPRHVLHPRIPRHTARWTPDTALIVVEAVTIVEVCIFVLVPSRASQAGKVACAHHALLHHRVLHVLQRHSAWWSSSVSSRPLGHARHCPREVAWSPHSVPCHVEVLDLLENASSVCSCLCFRLCDEGCPLHLFLS